MLVWDSGVVDGSGARKLADKGDGFGDGVGLPDVDRLLDVNPTIEGGEELNGMFFRTGDLRDGKEAGKPSLEVAPTRLHRVLRARALAKGRWEGSNLHFWTALTK
jgi:hypothetical protein